jgi:hypothetical protein
MGCCDSIDVHCTFFGECLDYREYHSSSLCDDACEKNINTMKWYPASKPA